jgi:hypothetical protein
MLALLLFLSIKSQAVECKPFATLDHQSTKITITKLTQNDNGEETEISICEQTKSMRSFDVRNREAEAYICLKPNEDEVLTCDIDKDQQITAVPASWIRNWKPKTVREYRFHAYITKRKDPAYYKDIFSRSLSPNLKPQNITIEGAIKNDPKQKEDGYFIRVEFQK